MHVIDCGLADIKCSGNFYTWNNKQYDKARIYSKLDKILPDHAC